MRLTGRPGEKSGLSDPVVPNGRAIAQWIKATPGITGLSSPRVHIDGEVWHLDVGAYLILGLYSVPRVWLFAI